MKVRYSVTENLTYSGVMEVEDADYEEMKDKSDDELGDFLLDRIDRSDPQQWNIDSVDEFEPV